MCGVTSKANSWGVGCPLQCDSARLENPKGPTKPEHGRLETQPSAVWNEVLLRSSKLLLKRLKDYQKKIVNSLEKQIEKEKAKLSVRLDYMESIETIYYQTIRIL